MNTTALLVLATALQDAPLTGASVSWDAKLPVDKVDLLKKVDLRRDQVAGTWAFTDGRLSGGDRERCARLLVSEADLAVPDEYNLLLTVTRTDGTNSVFVSLPTPGGHRAAFVLDWAKTMTGVAVTRDKQTVIGATGAVLAKGKTVAVVFMVRAAGVVVQIDGKDYIGKRLDWASLEIDADHDRPDQKGVCLGMAPGVRAVVTKLMLTYPTEKK